MTLIAILGGTMCVVLASMDNDKVMYWFGGALLGMATIDIVLHSYV